MTLKSLSISLLMANIALTGITLSSQVYAESHHKQETQIEKGPNNGRMLRQENFALELALFEDGVPPEFHLYPTFNGQAIQPQEVEVEVMLTRLGNISDPIKFVAEQHFLRGQQTITEPHSFIVTISARYQGKQYQWSYDNFEGRVRIKDAMAKDTELNTEMVSAQTLQDTLTVYGRLVLSPDANRHIRARFPGEVKKRYVSFGQWVKKGQRLLTVESNESLQSYDVFAPAAGLITVQNTASGEQTSDNILLTITDTRQLIAELSVFPKDMHKVSINKPVTLTIQGQERPINAVLTPPLFKVNPQQATLFRAQVANPDGQFSAGQFVKGVISLQEYQVERAVKTQALQSFRDFTVVYAKVDEQYEVRMLELGRQAGPWVEVLNGIPAGAEYVVQNSYLIKADIEKAGAAHDH